MCTEMMMHSLFPVVRVSVGGVVQASSLRTVVRARSKGQFHCCVLSQACRASMTCHPLKEFLQFGHQDERCLPTNLLSSGWQCVKSCAPMISPPTSVHTALGPIYSRTITDMADDSSTICSNGTADYSFHEIKSTAGSSDGNGYQVSPSSCSSTSPIS